jgi:hypothetical protein
VAEAQQFLLKCYRRDRTEGQPFNIYLGVEKVGLVAQLEEWFGELGVPALALGGYGSQTYVDEVVAHVSAKGRPAVLLYAGDCDASGEDIDRDFIARTGCWDEVRRVALTEEQVVEYGLPPQPGKAGDSRNGAFIRRHGRLAQVELDALPPDVLRGLYGDAIEEFWDRSAYEQAIAREDADRRKLTRISRSCARAM